VPNVTAIDWKQADVYGPSFERAIRRHELHGSEARAAFHVALLALSRLTLAAQITASPLAQKTALAPNSVGDARDLNVFRC
jgi:hypothetical protein